jgi:hypothetical protein
MGNIFSQLTNQGTALKTPEGNTSYIGNPNQVLQMSDRALNAQQQGQGMGDYSQMPQTGPVGSIGKPSFEQAAAYGGATSPGLSKAGKLAVLLQSGLQGALAGRAANEQATIASGGRRSGGAGMGFEAGYTLPWQRAGQELGLEKEAAQTNLLKEQANMVPTQYGPMPAALARYILPAQIRGEATTGAAQTRAGATTQAAQISSRFKAMPGVGLFDTQANGGKGAIVPGSAGTIISPEMAEKYDLPGELIGKPLGQATPIASLSRASVFQNVPEMTAEGPIVVNRRSATAVPVSGPGGQRYGPTGLAMPKEVADVNNPGQTTIVPAGQAFGKPGTGSASVQVPRAAARAEVPTKIGDQRVAFTTMIQHAELLRDAARALQNGDVQTLAGLKNAFKNEFGYSGPITAKAISDAYGGEVTNVISKGHITDAEMAKTGKSIDPSRQNFATVNGVLNAYQALAQSKMNMLNQQKQNAINQSQPKNAKANDPAGIRPK